MIPLRHKLSQFLPTSEAHKKSSNVENSKISISNKWFHWFESSHWQKIQSISPCCWMFVSLSSIFCVLFNCWRQSVLRQDFQIPTKTWFPQCQCSSVISESSVLPVPGEHQQQDSDFTESVSHLWQKLCRRSQDFKLTHLSINMSGTLWKLIYNLLI